MNTFKNLYKPADMSIWKGRQDAKTDEYFYQIIKPLDLNSSQTLTKNSFALLGFASDTGVKRNFGRPGAAAGPEIIKQALARLPLHRDCKLYDAGMIVVLDEDLESAQNALAQAVVKLRALNCFPIILGGGHETAWGHYQGLYQSIGRAIPILNFDAHFDLRAPLRENYGTSGTPFHQIASLCQTKNEPFDYNCIGIQSYGNTKSLFEQAHQLGVQYLLAEDIHHDKNNPLLDFINKLLHRTDQLYVTLCLDVLAASYAPGVSAPQVLGLTPWQILTSLRCLALSGKMTSLDLVEYAPCYDNNEQTAKLAAIFISDFLHHVIPQGETP